MNFVSKIKENPLLIFQAILIVLLILLAIVFVVVLCSDKPEWSFKLFGITENGESKYEVLKFLGIGMGGILVALQALASHRRAKAMEDTAKTQVDAANAQADAAKAQANAAQAQARATEEQARANEHTEQGLRQERLKNAIEHLGHDSDSVRLGGAYELLHLARDIAELRQTVLDILCAHIRRTTGENEYRKKHESKPSEEVQSLLTLLFVQNHEIFKGLRINLQESWLNGANLIKARLQKAILTGASLQEAGLRWAYLQGADLEDAQLQEANLSWARLQGADLKEAHLQGADLRRAHLQGAYLYGAYLQGADLSRAHLQGAYLHHLQGTDLYGAHLQGADLSRAHLQGTDLYGAHLQGAHLFGAYLQGAHLSGAHLQGADLRRAHLQGAHLEEGHLQGVESVSTRYVSFKNRIRKQIGKETDLSDAIFAGGLSGEDVDALIEGLSDRKANELREELEPHVDRPPSNELPEDSEAITGAYTEEEAEEWIAEYEEARSEDPEDDS